MAGLPQRFAKIGPKSHAAGRGDPGRVGAGPASVPSIAGALEADAKRTRRG
jgi:hypothetical protein